LNIYAAASLSGHLEKVLGKISVSVRWLGMLTFSLYLCHRPLLNFFSVFSVSNPESLIQKVWLFSGTFLVVIVVAYSGEFFRSKIRILFANVIDFKRKIFSPGA
jgi:peptidoglycan/LPS O-acetylase OafA/YrhL